MTDTASLDEALRRPNLPASLHRAEVVLAPRDRWAPSPGTTGTLVVVVSGTITLHTGTRSATFGPGSLLPFTPTTDLSLRNRTQTTVAIVAFTRTRMCP